MIDHVKVPAVAPRIQYRADGVQTAFPFPFPIFDADDLKIFLNAAPRTTGYAVFGAGVTGGGTVTFEAPPADGVTVTLVRRMTIERTTDWLESAPLTARSLNDALDAQVAVAQQLADEQSRMLRYPEIDLPAGSVLPDRATRAGRLLAFDGDGTPTVAPVVDGEALATFLASGTGAVARPITGKLGEVVSVRDFGAVGDGVADDTLAVQAALAAHRSVYLPPGIYRITATLVVGFGATLAGAGDATVLKAASDAVDLIELPDGYATVRALKTEGGATAIRLRGRLGPCVQNTLSDLTVWDAGTGLLLDGHVSTDRPCYWNQIDRVLVVRPRVHGVHLTKSGAGDTPNANRFHLLRVYSMGTPMTGSGIWVENGRFNNSFTDCEVNVWHEAHSCVRVGGDTDKTLFVNLYTETIGAVTNVLLEAGSVNTAIVNLLSASAGAAIWDFSGGKYTALNAGYPEKNRLDLTRVKELVVEGMRYDTEWRDPTGGGLVAIDMSSAVWLVSAFGGPVEARLPSAGSVNGATATIKKTDQSANAVTVTETDGPGPDGRPIRLASRHDHVTVVSNGNAWHVIAHNLMPANALYHEGAATVAIDTARAVHMVSAWGAPVAATLPAPGDAQAVGRTVTVKKVDQSTNAVTVTQPGGGGPDNAAIVLSAFGHTVTAFSDGGAWRILSRNP
jgi:hypothetical protein